MGRRIAIAVDIGDPAERSTIRHPHRERPAGYRHAGREQRRCRQHLMQRCEELDLAAAIQITRVETKPARRIADRKRRRAFVLPEVGLHRIFTTARHRPGMSLRSMHDRIVAQAAVPGKTPADALYAKWTVAAA